MEMNVHMAIIHQLQFSPTVFDKLQSYMEFKADFHHVSIRAWKEPKKNWHEFPYLVTDDAIPTIIERWLAK